MTVRFSLVDALVIVAYLAGTTILGIAPSSKDPDRGVVHVASLGRKQDGQVVIAFERKVQVWKSDLSAPVDDAKLESRPVVECTPVLPAYDAARDYRGDQGDVGSTVGVEIGD